MPFTREGITPDIIINPHAIPSRMTVAQLIECVTGKCAALNGDIRSATSFSGIDPEDICNELEKIGYDKRGRETMFSGLTGKELDAKIFIGPTYYQRLKHMTADKCHCLTLDHEILTSTGWKFFKQLTYEDKIATLSKEGNLVYDYPLKLLYFPDFEGEMYKIKNQNIDLNVTSNHRMYVSTSINKKWNDHTLIEAKEIFGKHVKYKRNAEWTNSDFQFILPACIVNSKHCSEIKVDMDAWLTFFGIWMAEGWTIYNDKQKHYSIVIASNKLRVKKALYEAVSKLNFHFNDSKQNKFVINSKQLYQYMHTFSVKAPNKYLPDWCFQLSKRQAKTLIHGMCLGDGELFIYYTSSIKLADDFQRLCLHAGYSSNKSKHHPIGNESYIEGIVWRLSIVKTRNQPAVNHGHTHTQKIQQEKLYNAKNPVFCLQVPTEVFYVRRNGKPCWTGNSRARGPVQLLTRQPVEGRSKEGGLRFGEMERDALISHGAARFLKERLMDVSDSYTTCVCKTCGFMAIKDQQRDIMICKGCKTSNGVEEIKLPYACKLLFQELMSINIAPKIRL